MMRKNYLLSIILLSLACFIAQANDEITGCSCKTTNHTFFYTRPQFDIGSPEFVSLNRTFPGEKKRGFSATIYGGKSTNNKDLSRYFMPYCEPSVDVSGQVGESNQNLMTQHFNLFSVQYSNDMANAIGLNQNNITNPFKSTITFKPEQSVVGVGLTYQNEFCFHGRKHWLNISAPIQRVQNTMGLEENIKNQGDFYPVQPIANQTTNLNTSLKTMEEALVQDDWEFGKIDHKKRSVTRLAFINIIVGQSWAEEFDYHLEPFFGISIPTGNKPKAEHVFEPIVGHGGHFGLIWGGSGGAKIWENDCCDSAVSFETTIAMKYLFTKTQKRSLNLKYKPWSRYIETYEDLAQATQANGLGLNDSLFLSSPGINLLTQDVKVTPGFDITANMAFVFFQTECDQGFDAELGYNFYAKQAECLKLKENFETQAAIKDHVGMGITSPVRNISTNLLLNEASYRSFALNGNPANFANVYNDAIIKETDLDLASAAHPCAISHTIYGALGYHWDETCYPFMLGLGGSYEFSGKSNVALDRWLLWGKCSISF